jgi:hypothetical protein
MGKFLPSGEEEEAGAGEAVNDEGDWLISLSFFCPVCCEIREAWRLSAVLGRWRRGGRAEEERGGRAGFSEREYIGICFAFF